MDAEKSGGGLGRFAMNDDSNSREVAESAMHRREITLADGRYMIFYTFGSLPQKDSTPSDLESRGAGDPEHDNV